MLEMLEIALQNCAYLCENAEYVEYVEFILTLSALLVWGAVVLKSIRYIQHSAERSTFLG